VKDSGKLFPGIGGILDFAGQFVVYAPIMYLVFAARADPSMKRTWFYWQHRFHRHQHREGG